MPHKKTVYFLATKEIGLACLKHVFESKNTLNIEILGVLTNNRKLSSTEETIENFCLQNNLNLISNLNELQTLPQADFLVSVQYHEILQKNHIAKALKLAVNLHMAPLPEYRGCNQFSFAIANGDKWFGTTLHVLTEGIDSGPLLFEDRFEIPDNIFVKDLYEITFNKSIQLFKNHWVDIITGNYRPISQSVFYNTRKQGFFLRNQIQQLKEINSQWPIEKQKRHFRATFFPPFEPPYLIKNGQKIPLDLNWYNQLA